ncbi:DUF5063 domain-containing protein [Georgenia sp. 311]|uniref:DUF5063 domain-containing protein n=1 Tax=Georgenia sp. 311 TaxID=2585134 RepID=UPI001111B13C|nr:DUF5063 domain-containing protein [Georgenia sp. 311]TNC17529.1 DUF5063 domain-containing protein [Georgenia sp. 311]
MPEHNPVRAAEAAEVADLRALAAAMAAESERYLATVTEVAAGAHPDAAMSLLLLAVADLSAAGARLGAVVDVVPPERFEPDDGTEPDTDPLRLGLANLLEGLDEYREVPDPLVDNVSVTATLSADLAEVAHALRQGLQHHRAGNDVEALWWWQFSYLSNWGDRAASALRTLLSVLSHVRLDVPADVAADAEFDALHAEID